MAGVLRQDKRYKYVWETDKVGMIGCDSFRQAACLRAPRARCGQEEAILLPVNGN